MSQPPRCAREHKAQWRARIRAERATRRYLEDAPAAVARQLGAALAKADRPLRAAAVYLSYGTEVPTAGVVDFLRDVPLYLPQPTRTPAGMAPDWVRWDPEKVTDEQAHAIARAGTALPPAGDAELAGIDLCLIPALALDRRGYRLGQGGGWYDRALPRLPRALRVGVTWDEDVVVDVPHEPHDLPVDLVVTPTRFFVPTGR
ncbi:MAG: 5-formyltetrahydrofolate cyclo-ligase [Actinomycetaceae bacterium]|nr:5-formyltetrahydrofolate cyclo-ligase [Actinomycetaceae bacterium]MDU0970941.1 5-formyltetrahydrofolate cyclo-ligase [Actinomycetaceae bacterium]